MAGAFTAVDLSKLSPPDAVEQFDYQTILDEMVADLRSRDPAFSALVESDPAFKVLEVCAYRETLIRQRTNEAVFAVMLAYANGADLDQLAANRYLQRLVITPANPNTIPPTPAVLESDADLRRRIQLSFEGYTTAGSRGAYVFHALGADADVLDADAYGPPETPGVVHVAVLSRNGTGEASSTLRNKVAAALNASETRPLTDNVQIRSAQIVNYQIAAVLKFYSGPDSAVVMESARKAAEDYTKENHRLGRDITLSGIYRALHQEGVQNVALTNPTANIVIGWDQAAWCSGIILSNGGTDE